jgi:hypothetical protein
LGLINGCDENLRPAEARGSGIHHIALAKAVLPALHHLDEMESSLPPPDCAGYQPRGLFAQSRIRLVIGLVRRFPEREYATCVGPPEAGGFKPFIFITPEGNQAVDDYVKSQTEKLTGAVGKLTLVDKGSFKTDHGDTGMRLVVRNDSSPRKVESIRYVFSAKNGLLLVFKCQCLSADDAQFRPIFDASMKSLTLDKD